jgi:hypothetical protein
MPSAFTILANDELTPSGTFYLTTVFDSNGARVFGPERWVFSGTSPIDLDTMTPTIVDPAFADPILSNPTASQTITGFPLITDISSAASVTSNVLRGIDIDKSDNAHTGDTNETDLATFALAANTMGATGALHVIAVGTTTGTTDTKTVKLDWGSVTVQTISIASGASSMWGFDTWIYNTATNAQRIFSRAYEGITTLEAVKYQTTTQDTTASVTIKCTATLGGTTDTITQTLLNTSLIHIA